MEWWKVGDNLGYLCLVTGSGWWQLIFSNKTKVESVTLEKTLRNRVKCDVLVGRGTISTFKILASYFD